MTNPATIIEKLQILLPHWIEHNRNHEAEFRKWAAAARTEGSAKLAELLETTSSNMAAAGELLKKAEKEVGHPDPDHVQSHHHHN